MKRASSWVSASVAVAMTCMSSLAHADVDVEGQWPEAKSKVTMHLVNERKDLALSELAKKAGWNVVLHGDFGASGKISLDVEDAEARDVAESILSDGSFTAKSKGERGSLIEISAITRAEAAHAEAAPKPTEDKKRDRAVLGQNVRVEKDEVVGDVSVTGGSAEIFGKVEGDLVVTGGSATVHDGAVVAGDAMAIGGVVRVEPGGKVHGDHKLIGGAYLNESEPHTSTAERATRRVSNVFESFTFLFVIGALFLATAPNRMQRLRGELASKPVASVAYGIGGLLALGLAALVLCVTVIGIPFAAILAMLAAFAISGSLSAALTTAGAALLGHRTQNQYVQLAVGAALFAGFGILPWIGGLVQAGVILAACGVLVTTRVAGYVPQKSPEPTPSSGLPYR